MDQFVSNAEFKNCKDIYTGMFKAIRRFKPDKQTKNSQHLFYVLEALLKFILKSKSFKRGSTFSFLRILTDIS